MDTTAPDALSSLHVEMAKQGIVLVIARSKGFLRLMLGRAGLAEQIGAAHLFPSIEGRLKLMNAGASNAGKMLSKSPVFCP